jgi:hypothetical protein
VRLKRPMRHLRGSCALSAVCAVCVEVCALSALCALCVEVCALSALCAIRVGFGVFVPGFQAFDRPDGGSFVSRISKEASSAACRTGCRFRLSGVPVTNGTISLYKRPVCQPASVSSGLEAGDRRCGVFQVVKSTQSRGRTGRTLLARWFLLSAGSLEERRESCGGLIQCLDVTLPFAISESSF